MAASSPPKLLVNSSHTMEEMCVITIDFLAKLSIVTSEDLRVNIEVRVVMITRKIILSRQGARGRHI